MNHIRIGLCIASLVFILDQASKWWMLEVVRIAERPPIEVAPFFNLVMVWNTGISFGLFADADQRLLLIVLTLAIVAVLLAWLLKTTSWLAALSLGGIIGGAAGNVADRMSYGAVADFFDFHLGPYHWPAFNLADSAIVIGVVLLCIHSMFMSEKPENKP